MRDHKLLLKMAVAAGIAVVSAACVAGCAGTEGKKVSGVEEETSVTARDVGIEDVWQGTGNFTDMENAKADGSGQGSEIAYTDEGIPIGQGGDIGIPEGTPSKPEGWVDPEMPW